MPVRQKPIEFKLDLKKFADKIDADFDKVKRAVGFHLYAKITRRTPVDKGTLRQSWYMTDADVKAEELDAVPGTEPRDDKADPRTTVPPRNVAAPPAGNVQISKDLHPYAAIKIINPLPYAARIEFTSYSKQAPAGMVRVSVAEVAAGVGRIMGD